MMKIIKKIKSSKALVTLVWVLGILVIWETFAFVVAATKQMCIRDRSNSLLLLYQMYMDSVALYPNLPKQNIVH